MTIYETIKAAISVKQAAEHYGLKAGRNGMACCPFHNDRHSSLKLNEDYFFCFGCGAKGDVIDLVARLFNMSSYKAAQKLASDFGLDPKPPIAAAMDKPKRPYIRHNNFSVNIVLEFMHYKMYECKLMNADGKEVERTVISKDILSTRKGQDIQGKILNNEYYLDLYDKKK